MLYPRYGGQRIDALISFPTPQKLSFERYRLTCWTEIRDPNEKSGPEPGLILLGFKAFSIPVRLLI